MTLPHPIVFLIDVDNTLLDNHGIQQDPSDHLERAPLASRSRERHARSVYGAGYRDRIRAPQRSNTRESAINPNSAPTRS
jgi:hypothetical protein